MVKDLTVGSVPKLILMFAAPLFVSNALQAVYNIVDMIIVGQVIGSNGMSAVATGGNILNILNFIVMGFAGAGQVIIARAVGEKDMDTVKHVIGNMFTLLLSAAVVMSIISYFIRNWLLQLVNTPAEAYDYTLDYTLVCMIGLVFIYGYNIVSAIMRGMGDSKRPFLFVAIASVVNIVLDILFVAVMGMEVMGAALATVIGQGVSFLFAIVYFIKHKDSFGFDFKLKSFALEKKTLKRLVGLGVPMAIQSAAITISMTVVAAWVNAFDTGKAIFSACAGVLNKLNLIIGILSQALTTAAASMTGQNLGAKKFERVPKILFWASLYALSLIVVYVIALISFPEIMVKMFTSDADIVAKASIIIVPCIINAFGAVTRVFAFGIINGSGNSKLNLLVAIIDGMIARIVLAYLLGYTAGMGPKGFWIGDAAAGFVPLFIAGIYYVTGKWKKIGE